jgi:hypothetical protein
MSKLPKFDEDARRDGLEAGIDNRRGEKKVTLGPKEPQRSHRQEVRCPTITTTVFRSS